MTAGAAEQFFAALAERGHEPLLAHKSGTVRFDLRRGSRIERWHLTVDRGAVTVTRRNDPADCVVASELALFDDVASGRANATAALLRGAITADGDPRVLVALQRLLPGRSSKRRPKAKT